MNILKYVLIVYHTRADSDLARKLPSFLLCTLAYAFWFSLAQIGPPLLWPLIWLALTFVIAFNPIRVSPSDVLHPCLTQTTSGYVEFHVGPRPLVDNQEHSQAWSEWGMEGRGSLSIFNFTRQLRDLTVFQFTDFWLGYVFRSSFHSKVSHSVATQ